MPLGDENVDIISQKDSLKKFIDSHIQRDKVVIFSQTTCRYCDMVKRIFRKMGHPYTAVELDDREDYDVMLDVFKEMTGTRAIPQVFVNRESIGGAWRTNMMFVNGFLHRKLGIKEPDNRHMEAHIDN